MASITQQLAQFVVETRTADIPDAVLDAARNALIDTVGVALAGTREPASDMAWHWLRDVGARPQATVWGRYFATSVAEAAFANAIASHALDFDDSHPGARGHASASLVPVVLATGERQATAGNEALAAYALALEVGGKIGRALGPGHLERGWHPTATVGIFAATAAAARILKLDAPALQRAWGIATSQMGGLVRNFGTMTKPFHAGHVARSAVVAAWMARTGFTADEAIFDGKGNVLETYRGADGDALESLLPRLGNPWEILEPGNYVKRWPCCYSNHRAIGGLLEIIEAHHLQPDEVSEITIGFLPGGDTALVSRNPHTGLEAKFSIEYVMAATLLDRRLTLDTFSDAALRRPQIQALMNKVRRHTIPDSKLYSGIAGHIDLAVHTARGTIERRVVRVPGSPAWPLSEADRVAKFKDCAEPVLGMQPAERLLDLCQRCGTLPDIRPLLQATVPTGAQLQDEMPSAVH